MSTAITKRRQAPRTRPVFFSRQALTSSITAPSSPSTGPFTPVPNSASTTRSAKSRSTRAAAQASAESPRAVLRLPAAASAANSSPPRRESPRDRQRGKRAAWRPASRKRRATTMPSPPLFPLPQSTTILRVGQIGKMSLQIIRHARAGVLHQLQAGNAVALGGQPVGLAHLFRGKYFHIPSIMARSWPMAKESELTAATPLPLFCKCTFCSTLSPIIL